MNVIEHIYNIVLKILGFFFFYSGKSPGVLLVYRTIIYVTVVNRQFLAYSVTFMPVPK